MIAKFMPDWSPRCRGLFRGIASPAVFCHKKPARVSKTPLLRALGRKIPPLGLVLYGIRLQFLRTVLDIGVEHSVSRPSGKLSPATNILRIFDIQSWVMIGVSILSVIAAFIVISRVGRSYGVETSLGNFLFFPLASLTGENMSTSFKKKSKNRNKSFFSPGFSLNGLLLIWTIAAAFISMAFLSMIRATLMIPIYGEPIDTAEDIFKEEKTAMIGMGLWQNYLKSSNDPWLRKTGKFQYTRQGWEGKEMSQKGIFECKSNPSTYHSWSLCPSRFWSHFA